MLQARTLSLLGTPGRNSISGHSQWWLDDHEPLTPHRDSFDYYHPNINQPHLVHGARDLTGFSTPQRVTIMGRQHDWVEFRTPQHPASGSKSNHWGGDSPLLLANIPRKSLDLNYLRFNPLGGADEGGFGNYGTVLGTPMNGAGGDMEMMTKDSNGDARRRRIQWVLKKLGWRKKEKVVMGGEKKKRARWFSGRMISKRWPQGW